MTTLTTEPDRIDLDHATGACIVRLREERDAAVAALRDRDATIARLTAAVEARDAAVREYLAARTAHKDCDATEEAAAWERHARAIGALAALTGGDHG